MKFNRRFVLRSGTMLPFAGFVPATRPASPTAEDRLLLYQTDLGAGNTIFTRNLDGSGAAPLVPEFSTPCKHPDWSPDGTKIVFASDDDAGNLYTVNADGTDLVELLSCGDICAFADFPAWSPDGEHVAFTGYSASTDGPPPSSHIYVLEVATGAVTAVVEQRQPYLVDVPRWSPDGNSLVVGIDQFDEAFNEVGSAIAIVSASGGDLDLLTDYEDFAYYPDWSWTSDAIVFSTETLGYRASDAPPVATWNLFTIRPDGSDKQQITDSADGHFLWQPSWVPGENRLTATEDSEQGRRGVWVDVETGEISPIAADLMTHTRAQPQ